MSDKESQGIVDRRRFVQALGAGAATAGLAGCGQSDTTTEGDGDTPTDGDGDTPTDGDGDTPTDEDEDTTTEGPETPPQGGTLTMALPSSPPSVNVLTTSSSYATAIMDFIWEFGTFLDWTTFEVKPWVFTDWTMENTEGDDPNPDVYFNVRDGLTWTDGEDFTVSDVIFTYEYLLEQMPGKYASSLNAIDSVEEASGDWDVHLSMNQVVGTYALNQLGMPLLPEHVWSDVDDYTQYQPGQQVDNGGPVGLGMAELTQYEPDTSIELTFRDPDEYQLGQLDWLAEHDTFTQGGPFLDELRYLVYTSESAYVEDYFNDEIDSMYNTLPAGDISQAREEDRQIIRGGDTGYGFFMFNLRRVPFDDATFRQAMEFLFDDIMWVRQLNQNNVLEGDFVMPPAYEAVRPESATGAEILEDPATNVFEFRGDGDGNPEYEAIRSFLTNGELVTGEGGTYAGKEYPGSLTGVTASQSSARHDYSFGDVQSSVLEGVEGVEQEIRVNGQTIPEIRGGPLTFYSYPPELVPELTEMDQIYVEYMQKLGIPIEREVVGFNSLLPTLYAQEDFDFTHLGWGNTSPLGVGSLYNLFHSDNADDHSVVEEGSEQENDQRQLNNNTGYGLFDHAGADDLISQARQTIDAEERNSLARQAVERIYLDSPYMVYQYSKVFWPLNERFNGAIENIPGVGGPALMTQMLNIYESE